MDAKAEYREYLKSKRWLLIRNFVLKRDRRRCKQCGSKKFLEVHHTTYRNKGGSLLGEARDCVTLCRECHRKEHFGAGK